MSKFFDSLGKISSKTKGIRHPLSSFRKNYGESVEEAEFEKSLQEYAEKLKKLGYKESEVEDKVKIKQAEYRGRKEAMIEQEMTTRQFNSYSYDNHYTNNDYSTNSYNQKSFFKGNKGFLNWKTLLALSVFMFVLFYILDYVVTNLIAFISKSLPVIAVLGIIFFATKFLKKNNLSTANVDEEEEEGKEEEKPIDIPKVTSNLQRSPKGTPNVRPVIAEVRKTLNEKKSQRFSNMINTYHLDEENTEIKEEPNKSNELKSKQSNRFGV